MSTATEELEALDRRVAEASARVRELDEERRRAVRAAERAAEPLRAYRVAIGAGEVEPDPEREAELEADAARARAGLAERAVMTAGRESERVLVDERAEALHEGAVEARDEAVRARDAHLRSRRAELIAEAMPEAIEAARELADRHAAVREADGAFHAAVQRLYGLGYDRDLPEPPTLDGGRVAALRRFAEGE